MKIKNFKFKIRNFNAGMTYVELIVVLSIFSVLSSVAIYNYGDFQSSVDIKNLASDIALQIVKAQKDSLSGLLPLQEIKTDWKPSYGVYFDLSKGATVVPSLIRRVFDRENPLIVWGDGSAIRDFVYCDLRSIKMM